MSRLFSKRLGHWALLAIICSLVVNLGQPVSRSAAAAPAAVLPAPDLSQLPALIAEAQQNGSARVIVSFRLSGPLKLGKQASKTEIRAQQTLIQQTRAAFVQVLSGHHVKVKAGQDWVFPAIALSADSATLQQLAQSPLISGISADHLSKITDQGGDSLLGTPATWNAGFSGQGQTVAILDTGVQSSHPFFGNRVVAEACYSTNDPTQNYSSLCPNGQPSQGGSGAGEPCPATIYGCEHGTHVAGIAAGNGLNLSGVNYAGVAINANIMAVQIFTRVGTAQAGYGLSAFDSDIISGLSWVATQSSSFNIAAVNLSLGNGVIYNNSTSCDQVDPSLKNAIDSLRTINIATVIAAGNDGSSTGISYPGCISSAISVGAVDNQDNIQTSFSNSGVSATGVSLPSLLAPGAGVYSSLPGNTYGVLSGTSMATPYVTGAIAVLKSEKPGATVDQMLGILKNTGRLLADTTRNQSVSARVQLDAAAAAFVPRSKTIGVFRNNVFYLRNSNTTGIGDETVPFGFGSANYPVVGDWTGSGIDRIGIYDQSKALFVICTAANSVDCAYTKAGSYFQFSLGLPGDQPLAGRWVVRDSYANNAAPMISGTPSDGVGVFRPSNGLIYLKNSFTGGNADYTMVLGIPGDIGIVGDWNGDGTSTPGVYRPPSSVYYLANSVCNCSVAGDIQFSYGLPYNSPIVGNWVGSPTSQGIGVGLYRPADGYFYLRNTLTSGFADTAFYYGLPADMPVSGHWR